MIRKDSKQMFVDQKIDNFEIFRSNSYSEMYDDRNDRILKINKEPYLDIVLTDLCNRKCKFCIANLIEKKRNCDIDVFKDQINWAIENLRVKEVLVVGGEPTIAPGLFPILDHLNNLLQQKKLKKISLTTNGDRLHKNGQVTDFARQLFSNVTHLNLSLMSTYHELQKSIAGDRGKVLDVQTALPAIYNAILETDKDLFLRINANVFRGNLDTIESAIDFYNEVSPYCDSVKLSPLLKVDNFSIIEKTINWVKNNILSPEEYENLYRGIESRFSNYPIVRNPRTFGFVEYSMVCRDKPLILNYNHRNQMAERASAGFVNNIKLLVNGDLSLSWNRDDEDNVIRRIE